MLEKASYLELWIIFCKKKKKNTVMALLSGAYNSYSQLMRLQFCTDQIQESVTVQSASNWWSGGCGFDPCRVGNLLSWRLIMKYFLRSFPSTDSRKAVSGKRMCTILVNCLEDQACPLNVWLGKLTAPDMTPLGWLVHKTPPPQKKTKVKLPDILVIYHNQKLLHFIYVVILIIKQGFHSFPSEIYLRGHSLYWPIF